LQITGKILLEFDFSSSLLLKYDPRHLLLLSSEPARAHIRPWAGTAATLDSPPHITVRRQFYHFTWVTSRAIPAEILNVILPACSRTAVVLQVFFLLHLQEKFGKYFLKHILLTHC